MKHTQGYTHAFRITLWLILAFFVCMVALAMLNIIYKCIQAQIEVYRCRQRRALNTQETNNAYQGMEVVTTKNALVRDAATEYGKEMDY